MSAEEGTRGRGDEGTKGRGDGQERVVPGSPPAIFKEANAGKKKKGNEQVTLSWDK